MSQFFISCKESKIENNRSFYGCFNLGPFEPSQSITIANALRRTLLSELYGLSIISVEIEGATHEYSNLNGVKDSVLDILLNLKEIILKKSINPLSLRNRWNFGSTGHEQGIRPQIGYLKARGPGIIRASNLRLPPFFECVDPDQYIATLAEDGFLNMRFIVQFGNKWAGMEAKLISKESESSRREYLNTLNEYSGSSSQNSNIYKNITSEDLQTNGYDFNNSFNFHLKKRRLILKKLRHIGLNFSNSYVSTQLKKKSRPSDNDSLPKISTVIAPWIIRNEKNLLSSLDPSTLSNLARVKKVSQQYPAINLRKKAIPVVYKNFINENCRTYGQRRFAPPCGGAMSKKKILRTRIFNKIKQNFLNNEKININPIQNKRKGSKFNSIFAKKKNTRSDNFIYNWQSSRNRTKNINNYLPIVQNSKLNSSSFLNSNPLTIDAVFNPITKVNYIIEVNDFKKTQASLETSSETLELFEILNLGTNIEKTSWAPEMSNLQSFNSSTTLNPTLIHLKTSIAPADLENILKIKRELDSFEKKEISKHNIILEIWTNGSIHPRDAIYEGFKNLVKLFSKLNKINAFMINPFIAVQNLKNRSDSKKNNQTGTSFTDLPDLLPLNETSFLSTYMSPKVKKYYSKNYLNNRLNQNYSILEREDVFVEGTKSNYRLSTYGKKLSKKETSLIKKNVLGNLDLGILNLSLRSYTCLKRLNINTIAELVNFLKKNSANLEKENSLAQAKLSKFSLQEIELSLKKVGIK